MIGFLEEVAKNILDENQDLRNLEIIVPNRRTGLFLKKALVDAATKTTWMPKITAIQEVFLNNSDLHQAEDLLLIYRLYSKFIKHTKSTESFDDFYYWGEIILSDFDDIDKYMVDASKLFSTIRDLKEIDNQFDEYEEKELEIIKRFWNNVNQAQLSIHKQKFLELWDSMFAVYTDFIEEILSEKIAYQGLVYRNVVNNIDRCVFEKSHYAIVGFNALNKCEKALLNHLKTTKNVKFYWDADKYYLDNEFQEAGRFLRENIRKFGSHKNIGIVDYVKPIPKDIEVIMSPSPVSQVKMLAGILEKWKSELDFNPEKTAIVLGDENLLIPLMYSMPPFTEPYNVSMGFPVKNSAAFGFLFHLVSLRKKGRKSSDSYNFYFKDVLSVINHSFIRNLFEEEAKEIDSLINKDKLIYVDYKICSKNSFLERLFIPGFEQVRELSAWFELICNELLDLLSEHDDFVVEAEFLSKISARISVLNDCLISGNVEIQRPEIFYKLLLNSVRSLSCAFEGEPLQGLQVLGFLETRCLDFDRVIMLSINEGVFPKKSAAQSLIPYNLRRFYELPSIEFQDSIFAYYFYRLLQRSKEVKIVYSAQAGDSTSEASRFISQIKYESGQDIKYRNDGYKINIAARRPVSAKKSPDVIAKIHENLSKGISPSALNLYLNCGFSYYLSYIEGIKEPKKLEEEEDGAFFGRLFHQIVRYLYEPYCGKVIKDEDFDEICKADNIQTTKLRAIKDVFELKTTAEINKYNEKLIVDIVMKYVHSLLAYDRQRCPFSFISLEEQYSYLFKPENSKLPEIKISGYIDRVDLQNGVHRVIDYKTGKVQLKASDLSALFEENRKSELNTITQIVLYSIMLSEKTGVEVCPGVFNINELRDDYNYYINLNNTDVKKLSSEQINEFLKLLETSFEKLLDENENFTQTDNTDTCKFCPYNNICDRK